MMMTFIELKLELSLELGREVARTTLWRWLQDTQIGTKEEYTQDELHVLAFFAGCLTKRRSVKYALRKLNEHLKHEYQEDQNRPGGTIPVEATAA